MLCQRLKTLCLKCPLTGSCDKQEAVLKLFEPATRAKRPPSTDIQRLIEHYKVVAGVDPNDTGWDKVYFSRFAREAKKLLELFDSLDEAKRAVELMEERMKGSQRWWNLSTVVKWAYKLKEDIKHEQAKVDYSKLIEKQMREREEQEERWKKEAVPMPQELKDLLRSIGNSNKML